MGKHFVNKPWGYEYLLFENDDVAIWHLYINAYQQTSLHSHPNKKTGLVILDGAAKVSFLGGENKLFYGEKIMIRHGVFHQTKSMTSDGLSLLEIENPVDKEDIVRLDDAYGRSGTTFMGEMSGGLCKSIDIEDGDNVGKCYVQYSKLDIDGDFTNFIITSGKITHDSHVVAGPGDILNSCNLKKLTKRFTVNEDIFGLYINAD